PASLRPYLFGAATPFRSWSARARPARLEGMITPSLRPSGSIRRDTRMRQELDKGAGDSTRQLEGQERVGPAEGIEHHICQLRFGRSTIELHRPKVSYPMR